MKANAFMTLISVLLSALFGYLVYYIAEPDPNAVIALIGSSVCFACTLVPLMGLKYHSSRIGTNARVLATLFFFVLAISNICFSLIGVAMPLYAIINGIIVIIYLAILYKIQNIKSI